MTSQKLHLLEEADILALLIPINAGFLLRGQVFEESTKPPSIGIDCENV